MITVTRLFSSNHCLAQLTSTTMIRIKYILLYFLFFVVNVERVKASNSEHCPNVKKSLESVRKRRHLTFPTGSAVGITTSCVKTFMTHVPSGWYSVLEADVVYHLPDPKVIRAHYRRKLHHRQKREFWDTIHGAFELQNLNGQSCVIRCICEAKSHLAPPGKSLVHDILRVIFTIVSKPDEVLIREVEKYIPGIAKYVRAPLHEEDFNNEIGVTYNELLDDNFCDRAHECPFSLLSFILNLNKPK